MTTARLAPGQARPAEKTEHSTGEPGDHDRFAHYVDKDDMTKAYVLGTPVRALCGKKWVPNRAPEKFPVCPDCKKIYDQLPE